MLFFILIFHVALVGWSLHLMQSALEQKEFSLMLAGTLVALSAAAMLVVYFLMDHCLAYLSDNGYSSYYPGNLFVNCLTLVSQLS